MGRNEVTVAESGYVGCIQAEGEPWESEAHTLDSKHREGKSVFASELTVFTRTGISFSLSPSPDDCRRAMARALQPFRLTFLVFSVLLKLVFAQNPSTNTQVPPLQWIDLSGLTSGSPPPGLKYASMGFDGTSQTVIVFGGEAAGGTATQQTYLYVFVFIVSPITLC